MNPTFSLEPLGDSRERSTFRCGDDSLDRYFQTQVTQDIRRRVTNCFVALETATAHVAGFYTIASAAIPVSDFPPEQIKRLPRYPTVPAVRIGRLAVDSRFQGRGVGAMLIFDVIRRVLLSPAAAYALLVDAKNDAAVRFYERHSFRQLTDQPRTLFLPLGTAEKLLRT